MIGLDGSRCSLAINRGEMSVRDARWPSTLSLRFRTQRRTTHLSTDTFGPKAKGCTLQTRHGQMQESPLETDAPMNSGPASAHAESTIPPPSLPSDLLLVVFIHGFVQLHNNKDY